MLDGSVFEVHEKGRLRNRVEWQLIGAHNVHNALAALAAAQHAGVPIDVGCAALATFKNVKRRLETVGSPREITIYDDFAHHPSAISTTLNGLRAKVGSQRILAVLEPRSNSMQLGLHKETLAESLCDADEVWILEPADLPWDLQQVAVNCRANCHVETTIDAIIDDVANTAQATDHILIMSNGEFGGIHQRLLKRLSDGN